MGHRAIFVNGLASIAGAFNYITTIVNMRCPGMTMFRLPLAVWSLFVTAILLLLAVPVLSAAAAMLWLDLNMGTTFFSGRNGARAAIRCCTSTCSGSSATRRCTS